MKVLSLKLKDEVFLDVQKVVKSIHVSRNAYINQALEMYNRFNERKLLKVKLQKESLLVSNSSLEILKEYEQLEDEHLL